MSIPGSNMNRTRNLSEDIRSRAAKKLKVISDSGPLISFGILQRFDVLQELFGEIYVPEVVYEEVVVFGCGMLGAQETRAAADQGWLQRVRVVNRTAVEMLLDELDIGEAEVLVLAKELKTFYDACQGLFWVFSCLLLLPLDFPHFRDCLRWILHLTSEAKGGCSGERWISSGKS